MPLNESNGQPNIGCYLITISLVFDCSLVASKVAIVSALATFCVTVDATIWAKTVWIKTGCVDKKGGWTS